MKNKYIFSLSAILKEDISSLVCEETKNSIDSIMQSTHVCDKISPQEACAIQINILKYCNNISTILENAELNEEIINFINKNKEDCYIFTYGLDRWIDKLIKKIGMEDRCFHYRSTNTEFGKVYVYEDGYDINKILKDFNSNIISIGRENIDMILFKNADIKIAYKPSNSLLNENNFAFYDEKKLCDFLNRTTTNLKKQDNTVIISCAGMGTRLKQQKPKCLVDIEGKSLIQRHLQQFSDVDDLRIVVGYKSDEVINEVLKYRKDVTFVFNGEYMKNGTGASVCRATPYSNQYIITIDGDLIIHPNDINKILKSDKEFAGVCKASTDNPMLTKIEGNNVVGFSRDEGTYEWTGISRFNVDKLVKGEGHVCGLLESFLPLPYLFLNTKEIDTPHDLECAVKWIKNNYSDNITIGVVGGMGTVATHDFFGRLINAFPADKEWERPRILIDNRCSMPSRVRGILYDERVDEIIDSLYDSIKMLSDSNSDYIVLACNTSHYYLNEILKRDPSYSSKVIDIIELCSRKLNEKNVKNFTLLASEGTYLSKIYDKYLDKYGIKYSKVVEDEIRKYIESVKQLRITNQIKKDFINFVNNTPNDTVVLGCTELPVIYGECKYYIDKQVYDPLEFAINELKEKQKESTDIFRNVKVKKLV